MKKFKRDLHITAKPPEDASGLPERATNRLRIDSWERSNRRNDRAGDAIALHWMRPEAKAFIGWWDTTDPDNPVCKAWIGAHDEANNPDVPPHRHWSVEVTDSTGQMQTRLGIPYDKDHTNITATSADFTVVSGALRVPRRSSLEFSVDRDGETGSRWQVQMTPDENLELLHHPSNGSEPERIAEFDSETGRMKIRSLEAVDIVMDDRTTGAPTRLFVDNGQVRVEEI